MADAGRRRPHGNALEPVGVGAMLVVPNARTMTRLPMNQLLAPTVWLVKEKSDQAVSEFVDRVVSLTEPAVHRDRRRDSRVPFSHLLTLTPVDITAMGLKISGEPVTVAGKHLAGRGIDFYHSSPLEFKRAIVSIEQEELGLDAHFVLNIEWCRFLRPGWYDSGGRFTHVVAPEIEA